MGRRNNIKVERARKKISQADLAKEVGTTRQTINSIETGKSDPALGLFNKIAKFFGVSVEELAEES